MVGDTGKPLSASLSSAPARPRKERQRACRDARSPFSVRQFDHSTPFKRAATQMPMSTRKRPSPRSHRHPLGHTRPFEFGKKKEFVGFGNPGHRPKEPGHGRRQQTSLLQRNSGYNAHNYWNHATITSNARSQNTRLARGSGATFTVSAEEVVVDRVEVERCGKVVIRHVSFLLIEQVVAAAAARV